MIYFLSSVCNSASDRDKCQMPEVHITFGSNLIFHILIDVRKPIFYIIIEHSVINFIYAKRLLINEPSYSDRTYIQIHRH